MQRRSAEWAAGPCRRESHDDLREKLPGGARDRAWIGVEPGKGAVSPDAREGESGPISAGACLVVLAEGIRRQEEVVVCDFCGSRCTPWARLGPQWN